MSVYYIPQRQSKGELHLDVHGQPQGNYVPPYPQQQYQQVPVAPVITVKEWLITALIMLIPLVNIIMMFVFAFGEGNPSKQNYFKASLLLLAIILGIYLVFGLLIFGVLLSSFS